MLACSSKLTKIANMNTNSIFLKTVHQQELTMDEANFFMSQIMEGEISEILLSAWLTSLRIKKESIAELSGFVKAMKDNAVKVDMKVHEDFIDTCGTGGDEKNSINISTLSALTLASMDVKVAKHGNRSVSSACGSSDLLSGLGYTIEKDPKQATDIFLSKGFIFLFAPFWHPSMKHAANVRKTLGFRTVFNVLGPLCNPLSPTHQVLGVYNRELIANMIEVLKNSGLKSAIVCHSQDGFDEFSIFDTTYYSEYKNGSIQNYTFDPKELNLPPINQNEIFVDSKDRSIELSKRMLRGEPVSGIHAVSLNAGVGLYCFGKADSIVVGYKKALQQLQSGSVQKYFDTLL